MINLLVLSLHSSNFLLTVNNLMMALITLFHFLNFTSFLLVRIF